MFSGAEQMAPSNSALAFKQRRGTKKMSLQERARKEKPAPVPKKEPKAKKTFKKKPAPTKASLFSM